MKKFIQWLAKVFKTDIVATKIVIKEVEKQIALEGVIEGDVTVKGNLYVTGDIYVAGDISAQGEVHFGLTGPEVKMRADGEISACN